MKVNGDFMNYENKIKEFLKNNHEYIRIIRINKAMIKKYIDKGLIRKVAHGIYR